MINLTVRRTARAVLTAFIVAYALGSSGCTLIGPDQQILCSIGPGQPVESLSDIRGEWELMTIIAYADQAGASCESAESAGLAIRVQFDTNNRYREWRNGVLTMDSTYGLDGRVRIAGSTAVLSRVDGFLMMSWLHLDGPAYLFKREGS
jgi:hypothetical protein